MSFLRIRRSVLARGNLLRMRDKLSQFIYVEIIEIARERERDRVCMHRLISQVHSVNADIYFPSWCDAIDQCLHPTAIVAVNVLPLVNSDSSGSSDERERFA